MRTLERNKEKMFYSNYIDGEDLYERDEKGEIIYDIYIDNEGTEWKIPRELGKSAPYYSTPLEMKANIATSGGEVEAREFGLDVSDYSAVIICDKGEYNLSEKSLIWVQSDIGYKNIDSKEIEPNSADFRVVKVAPSPNQVKYLLQRITNNE